MSSIGFATSTKTLLKGAKTIAVVAPAALLGKRRYPKLLGKKLDALVVELAKSVDAGDMGASGTTLTGTDPAKLAVGVLPDQVSRYNAPSRAESVRRVVNGFKAGKGKLSIILVVEDPAHIQPQAIAIARCFPQYNAKTSGKTRRVQLLAVDPKGEIIKPESGVVGNIQIVRDSAELVDTPPSELDPEALAARARELLDGQDVEITEIVGEDLLEHGLGGIYNVGKAALASPRMLVAQWTPEVPDPAEGEDAPVQRHIALVGKGVTYDTGGLHLKPRGAMEGMKCDMGGAAAVLGAFRMLVNARCPHRVSLVLCLAENAIGPASYKPDDVLTMHSGKTVEINNTDAEGRLTLADALVFAASLEPDLVIDFATLTGACVVALGPHICGVMSRDDELAAAWLAAGERAGEDMWRLPLPKPLMAMLDSKIADLRNTGERAGGALTAGLFLEQFVEGKRWMHVDIAGPAIVDKPFGVNLEGSSGVPVATILEFLAGDVLQSVV